MILDKRVVVILPAYNAAKTLRQSISEIPRDVVDHIILVDDCSEDRTVDEALGLGVEVLRHTHNRGYGGNQKTCYTRAYEWGADIVVMLHPDYQYTPRLIRSMAGMIAEGVYDVVLGSRILGKGALRGGMPIYKYVSNRALTLVENWLIGEKLSEFHTGYRAFTRKAFEMLPFESNSDDFIFDNEMLVQCFAAGLRVAEMTCPTKYFADASSINFRRSVTYGLGCLRVGGAYFLHRKGIRRSARFECKVHQDVAPLQGAIRIVA